MPNQLIHETSPYLLQHANNPVDWHGWNQRSLALAAEQDKPILLSIGYAACHWCHVMEHESFDNAEIAARMNQNFLCIKVDREERPDLDKVYQTAHQMLTQRAGGWPLTVALTPDGQAPFFAGTYFPPEARHGMPGFMELLDKIASHYQSNRDGMDGHTAAFSRALSQLNPVAAGVTDLVPSDLMEKASTALQQQFDAVNGGFGDAPKFPHPTQLELLLRHVASANHQLTPDDAQSPHAVSLAMVNKTLRMMQQGGLFDQLEGGFFRYSVDKQWRIPHFEKMLYDNAQLLSVYALGHQLTGHDFYAETIRRTVYWATNEVQQAHGGFAATIDADSEGSEGKFYVWSETDLRALLSTTEYQAVENYFELYGEPNFEGNWHFNRNAEIEQADEETRLAMDKLRQARSDRVRPALDDKILTSWNGLMIKGMSMAGRILGDRDAIESAQHAVDFLRTHVWKNGRLLASHREQQATLNGYLDDYVFVAEGLLELLQVRWRPIDFSFLHDLCEAICVHFEDDENGGFYFTSHDHEKLLYRPKPGADDAIPSANGIAASMLYRVGVLTGNTGFIHSSERTLALYANSISDAPSVFASFAVAAADQSAENKTVVIRGTREQISAWKEALQPIQKPGVWIYAIAADAADLPAGLALKKAVRGKTAAYICQGLTCSSAITDLEELQGALA